MHGGFTLEDWQADGALHTPDMKWMLLALSLAAVSLNAQETDHKQEVSKYFAGLTLTDQDGKRVDLADLMKGHTVVIYTFFAGCKASCPVMAHSLAELQPRFADRLGKDLRFISITVDPENDTPEKLKAYATRNLAKRGWSFLTGSRAEVDATLRRIGQYAPSPDEHQNTMLIGNDTTGLWMKAQGLAKPKDLGDIIQKVADGEQP